MKTYPLTIYASKVEKIVPFTEGYQDEVLVRMECSDIPDLFRQVSSDGLQQELFKYLKKNFDQEILKERLCI